MPTLLFDQMAALRANSGLSNYEHLTKKHMVDQKTSATKAKMQASASRRRRERPRE
jgi:hypothetical protein